MAGLVPAIHVFLARCPQNVDARHKAGHDELKYGGRIYRSEAVRSENDVISSLVVAEPDK